MAGIRKSGGGRRPVSLIRGGSKSGAGRTKTKVAGTSLFRTSNGRYQNAKGKFVKASSVKRMKANRSARVGYSKASSDSWEKTFGKKKKTTSAVKRKKRVKAKATRMPGAYISAAATAPKKRRKKRKAPMGGVGFGVSSATTPKRKSRKTKKTAVKKTTARKKTRSTAATKRKGSTAVAKKRKTTKAKRSVRQKRSGRRVAAYLSALRSGKTKATAKRLALKKVPLAKGDSFKGTMKVGTISADKPRTVRGTKYIANKRRKKGKRKATSAATKRRRRVAAAKRPVVRRRRRAAAAKRTPVVRRRRRAAAKRRTVAKRKGRKTMRRNGRKSFRRNAGGWMETFKNVMVSGMFVTVGFLSHKVITNFICDPIFDMFKKKDEAPATAGTAFDVNQWKKPICGAGVLLVAVPALTLVKQKNRAAELGAGMVASWLHSILVSASLQNGNVNFVKAVAGLPERSDWTGRKWPYSTSRAAALAGRRRAMGSFTNTLPRYTPVNRLAGTGHIYQAAAGRYQQAAAGSYQQAAAGMGEYFQNKGMGEYFTPMNATGEYFAPASTQGVGAYEAAGSLAMPRNNQVIRDGIRPDGNLDREMSIMEAAAGLRGLGGDIETVGEESQWIPNGDLWAGELSVNASQDTSELSAGILNVSGGNGTLSG